MTEIVAARLGFGWGWDEGEDGWKPGVDQNFRMNDTFHGLTVIDDSLTAPPSVPSNGDTYIPAATATGAWATHENTIATYQNGVWYFYLVVKGLRALFVNHGDFRVYDGAAWGTENTYTRLPAEVQNIPIVFPFVGRPTNALSIYIPLVQATTIPANFAGSVAYSNATASATIAFTLVYIRAGASTTIGTVTFSSGSSAGVFSVQAQVNLLIGDILVCEAPTPQDASLADVGISLLLKKV